ncbi:hypothetical protein [Shimia ponticola]|uniref:hypothetical protein n=1 Tax=Shimia ponticola TaxID=2582893 RepID=UPI0011BD8082|nr:hypothetical protein [Shimia ponticola]
MSEGLLILIGAAIAIPLIMAMRYFAFRYGAKKAEQATEAFAVVDDRTPAHVQAWGKQALAFYDQPPTVWAIKSGGTPQIIAPDTLTSWYIGQVVRRFGVAGTAHMRTETQDFEQDTVRETRENYVLLYDADGDLLAHVGYMGKDDGERMTALLRRLPHAKQLPSPGKVPSLGGVPSLS